MCRILPHSLFRKKGNWRHPKEHKEELSDFNVTLVDQKATQKLLTKALDSLKAQKGRGVEFFEPWKVKVKVRIRKTLKNYNISL